MIGRRKENCRKELLRTERVTATRLPRLQDTGKRKTFRLIVPSAVSDSEGTKRKCTESINTRRNRSKHWK